MDPTRLTVPIPQYFKNTRNRMRPRKARRDRTACAQIIPACNLGHLHQWCETPKLLERAPYILPDLRGDARARERTSAQMRARLHVPADRHPAGECERGAISDEMGHVCRRLGDTRDGPRLTRGGRVTPAHGAGRA